MDAGQMLEIGAGVGALVTVIINILKTVGVIKDGQAVNWQAGLNLVAMAALFVLRIYRPELDPQVDAIAGQVAVIAQLLAALVVQMLAGWATHKIVAGNVPVIGFSYTARKQ